MTKRIASLLIGAGLLALSGAAAARGSVEVGISFGGPVYAPAPVYVAPPPQVVYYPRPVYVAPPEPVYYAPAPVYYGPPPHYYRGHHGHRHHHRHHHRW